MGIKVPKIKVPKAPKAPKAPKIDMPSTSIKPPKIDMPSTSIKPPKIDMPNAPKIDAPKPPKNIVETPYKPPKADAPNTKPPKADAPNTKPKKTMAQRAKDAAKTVGENAGDALELYNAAQAALGSEEEQSQPTEDQPQEEEPAQDPLTKPLEDKANGAVQQAAQNVMAGQGDNENKPSRDQYLDAISLVNRYEAFGCRQPAQKKNPILKNSVRDF